MGSVLYFNTTPQYRLVASGSNKALVAGTVTVTGISGTIKLIVIPIGSGGVPAVTDSSGNIYSYTTTVTAGGIYVRQAYVVNPTTTSSMTFTIASSAWSAWVGCFTVDNAITPLLDQQNGFGSANVTSISTGSITPSFTAELIVAAAATGSGATGSPGAITGYNLITLPFVAGTAQGCVIYWKSQLNIQPENVTFAGTSMRYWAATIASYKN